MVVGGTWSEEAESGDSGGMRRLGVRLGFVALRRGAVSSLILTCNFQRRLMLIERSKVASDVSRFCNGALSRWFVLAKPLPRLKSLRLAQIFGREQRRWQRTMAAKLSSEKLRA